MVNGEIPPWEAEYTYDAPPSWEVQWAIIDHMMEWRHILRILRAMAGVGLWRNVPGTVDEVRDSAYRVLADMVREGHTGAGSFCWFWLVEDGWYELRLWLGYEVQAKDCVLRTDAEGKYI